MLKNDRKVIEFLAKTPLTPRTSKEIREATEINYQVLASVLKRLTNKEILKRGPGPGNSFRYKINSNKANLEQILLSNDASIRKVSPFELFSALKIFSRGHKKPKFIETGAYTQYAQAVSGLYRHAVDTHYGAAPSQSELSYWRKELTSYANQLDAHLQGIRAILNTADVWNAKTSAVFLLGSEPDISEIKNMAEKALRENKK